MIVTRNKTVQSTGCIVFLTCSVELNPAVDVPVTVNTAWTVSPNVPFMLTRLDHTMNNLTKYTSKYEVLGLGGSCATGNFTCIATISSLFSLGPESSQCTCEIIAKVGESIYNIVSKRCC